MLEDSGRSIYTAALIILEAVLKLRACGDSLFLAGDLLPKLRYLFSAKTVVDAVVKMLRNSKRKDWYPHANTNEQRNRIGVLDAFLIALTQLPPGYVSRRQDPQVGDAQQKMGMVLSELAKDLASTPPQGVDLSPIANVRDVISEGLEAKKSVADIDYSIASELIDSKALDAEYFGVAADSPPPALLLGGRVPIWRWCDAYIKLVETYWGHPMR